MEVIFIILSKNTVQGFTYFTFFSLNLLIYTEKKKLFLEVQNGFKRVIHFKPDVVVSVHAHLNHGYFQILKQNLPSKFKFVIYCGEMSDSLGLADTG